MEIGKSTSTAAPAKSGMSWHTLAFMAFTTVFSFAALVSGFAKFEGLESVLPWVMVIGLYFVPYALMVGELGSAFKNLDGGVGSWINATIGPRIAYFAGWTYWVVHMPYLAQKSQMVVVAGGWGIFQDERMSSMNTTLLQIITLVLFIGAILLATRGISILKKIATIAGMAMFVMSILFIVMMWAAPQITGASVNDIKWSVDTFMPAIDWKFFTSLSILVLAVGGCEKISPYVNKAKNPAKDFPKAMIALAVMVAVVAILGTIALGMMFTFQSSSADELLTNGQYIAFRKLGEYYHVGNALLILYAIANTAVQLAILIISIDAPLRMLLGSAGKDKIPAPLFKKNQHGAYTNGLKMIMVIVSILIVIPAIGIKDVNALVNELYELNSICMPLKYLWVFVAYICLKKAGDKFPAEYRFIKNKKIGMAIGSWCFVFTAFVCAMGIFSGETTFDIILNAVTPIILICLGFIMPALAKQYNRKHVTI